VQFRDCGPTNVNADMLGASVKIVDLKSAALNGAIGVLGDYDTKSRRFAVHVNGRSVLIKLNNLIYPDDIVFESESDSEEQSF
jgi:hypothetical protein